MKQKSEVILGVDPGSNITGFAILEFKNDTLNVTTLGEIILKKYDTYDKLRVIIQELTKIIHTYKPTAFCIETPFYGKNAQSMLKLGRAQGVAIACARNFDLPVFEYSPRRIKQIVSGSGGSKKSQIHNILFKQFQLEEKLNHFDATDALSIALCHHYSSHHIAKTNWDKKSKRASVKKQWSDFLKTSDGKSKVK